MDLQAVIDFVAGSSGKRPSWKALVVYVPNERCFVELRDSPPDLRGNSQSEAEEVTENYIIESFPVTAEQISSFKSDPGHWIFIDNR